MYCRHMETRACSGKGLLFTTQSRFLKIQGKEPLEKVVGKGENAGNQHFLLFPQCFLSYWQQISIFLFTFKLLSVWTSPKFCHLGKS